VKFEHTIEMPAARGRVWAFVMDVPSVAKCVPGLEGLEDLGGDKYRATMKVRVGPISLALKSDLSIVEKDEAAGRAVLAVDAADKRIGGAVKAQMEMQIVEKSATTTELRIVTDAQVLGRIGDFGQPIIRKKADQTVTEITENMKKALSATPAA
jgi:carbon monoxide dehydrogenase subunit G